MNAGEHKKSKIIVIILSFVTASFAVISLSDALTWSNDVQLSTDVNWDIMPSVMQTRDGVIWVVWASDRVRVQYDIYYKTSSDNGLSWSNATRFTTSWSHDQWPSIMESQNGTIWIVWESDITGNKEIFYKLSYDGGLTWSLMFQLTNNTVPDAAPSVTQNVDGTIWVVWHRNASGNRDIYGVYSMDNGLTWSNEIRLTTDPSSDLQPSITRTQNGTLWLVWTSHRADGNYEIYYKTSSDNGLSWSNATRLTVDTASQDMTPSIIQDVSGRIWVVWEKELDIYYKTSSDFGLTWSADTRLISSAGDDITPSIMSTTDRKLWIVWESTRTGNFDIFYRVSEEITDVHDIAVAQVVAWKPPGSIVRWAPRGSTVYVNVTVENQGTFIEEFNVTAFAERTTKDVYVEIGTQNVSLTNGTATTVTFAWDTKDVPLGSYYIGAKVNPVPNEYDTFDNILTRGAYLGGIFLPYKQKTDLFAKLNSFLLLMLLIVLLGIAAFGFFRLLMSIKPKRFSLPSHKHHLTKKLTTKHISLISKRLWTTIVSGWHR